MDVTLAYRGKLRNQRVVETFEDRIVELAVEFGGYARIWRSASHRRPRRIIRGVMLDLAPGLQTVQLLVSPEGWLLPVSAVEDAEAGRLQEPPWIEVTTHFAALDAHVMLAEMLSALSESLCPGLEVTDRAGYWGARDLDELWAARRRAHVSQPSTAGPIPQDGPLDEAARTRLQGVARSVRRALLRPPEHPPVLFSGMENSADGYQHVGTEAEWDEFDKENQRKQAGLMRAFEERTLRGADAKVAFREALRSEGLADLPRDDDTAAAGESGETCAIDAEETAAEVAESEEGAGEEGGGADSEPFGPERHPLMRRMTDLTLRVLQLHENKNLDPEGPLAPLINGVLEMSGGLAQVLEDDDENEADTPFGYTLVQLKRALRGAAFARGALLPARAARLLREDEYRQMLDEIIEIEREIQRQARKTRGEM